MNAAQGADMVRTNYADMSARARRGRLDEQEVLALSDIPSASAEYRSSRALLFIDSVSTPLIATHPPTTMSVASMCVCPRSELQCALQ